MNAVYDRLVLHYALYLTATILAKIGTALA